MILSKKEYWLFRITKTFEEAEAKCKSLGAHLATIDNKDENSHVAWFMRQRSVELPL